MSGWVSLKFRRIYKLSYRSVFPRIFMCSLGNRLKCNLWMQAVKKNLFITCPSKSTYFTSLAATMTKAKKKGLKGTSSPLKFNSPTNRKK